LDPEAFQERYGDLAATTHGAVELAMMLEAQAHDYYVRCAGGVAGEAARAVVHTLAQEEKAHLRVLGNFLDTRPG
ncbi:MAG: sulfurtransferase, partial [Desulfovibrionaceae bacterium]